MPTRPPDVDVLGMPWRELVERVAAVAATGDRRARAELRRLVEEEQEALAEGREPGDVITRLATLPVLRSTHGSRST
jgi:hypothetical protein